ncbi:MAG: ATP-binding protein, partial [Candidatus Paceibacterota bacterium]
VFGNVGSMAVFRVSAEDAQFLETKFKPTFLASDMMKLDNFNAYVSMLINGQPTKPFNIETIKPPAGNLEIVAKIKELSYLKYGRPREEVEEEIMEKYRKE